MKNQFYLTFDKLPRTTAQQKRYNGRTHRYYKSPRLIGLEQMFYTALLPYRPKEPSKEPIKICLRFYFDTKDKRKWDMPKTSTPDVDNYCKAFLDQMTRAGFWLDDSQIFRLVAEKYYAETAKIEVIYSEVTYDE